MLYVLLKIQLLVYLILYLLVTRLPSEAASINGVIPVLSAQFISNPIPSK